MLKAWMRSCFGWLRSPLLRVLRFLPAAIFIASIFYISGKPSKDVPGVIKRFVGAYLRGDGTAHLLTYAALTAAMIWALWPNFQLARWSILLGGLLSSVCGAIDEFHQLYVAERCASVRDFFMDSLAALVVCLTWTGLCLLVRWRRRTALKAPVKVGGVSNPSKGDRHNSTL